MRQTAATIVHAERDHALETLRERIAGAVAHGELPGSVDASGLARTIGAPIQGMSVQARDGADYRDLASTSASARSLLTAVAIES